jgi:phosphoglycerate dehydrogenase-like enzyme
MIAVMRQISSVDREAKLGRWPTPMTRVLHDKTLGIVEMGRIGRYVAKIAAAFEMKVLAWSRRLTPEEAALVDAERRELDDLMSSSDVVSIHATLSDETRGLIAARRLGLMKPTAYLINTARGPIIDEPALCAALLSGQIAGAGLMVHILLDGPTMIPRTTACSGRVGGLAELRRRGLKLDNTV